MKSLVRSVRALIEEEYGRASEVFGKVNAADHHSYAVILEEMEEASDEFNSAFRALQEFWKLTKDKRGSDAEKKNSLHLLKTNAMLAACECIQVAAMAHKAVKTIEQGANEQ